jgi:glycosyltransferase involved in cell wall biosynthesis
MGFGPGVDRVREHEQRLPNIHYHPAVSPAEVSRYTCGADVGIHMMDDSCINHLHALPNKPMEYMNAGLPAIVSDLPEMGGLIRSAGAGWVVPVNDGAALRRAVLALDREEIAAKRRLAWAWTDANNWESEEAKLAELYRTLGFSGRVG